jgi:hypothetical protein
MSWHLQIGVDRDLLKKVDPKQNERQTFILSSLSIMLVIISLICFFSSIVYTLIVFHNWWIAIGVGFFLALVVFNLYRLFVMTALDVSGTSLEEYYINHEKHYSEHHEIGCDMLNVSDEKIQEVVATSKEKLREKSQMDIGRKQLQFSDILTMTLRVVILSIIALVFATGIELFIFKNQINDVLEQLKNQYIIHGETWMVENILTPSPNDQFYIFNANSLLLAIDILERGLGYWKVVMDIIFLVIFLIPLALVFKSKEIKQSEYMRELALSEITITFYHYLHTQKLCQKIIQEVKNKEIKFTKTKKLKASI